MITNLGKHKSSSSIASSSLHIMRRKVYSEAWMCLSSLQYFMHPGQILTGENIRLMNKSDQSDIECRHVANILTTSLRRYNEHEGISSGRDASIHSFMMLPDTRSLSVTLLFCAWGETPRKERLKQAIKWLDDLCINAQQFYTKEPNCTLALLSPYSQRGRQGGCSNCHRCGLTFADFFSHHSVPTTSR